MAEETLLIKILIDGKQPAQTIDELEKNVKSLTRTLKQVPQEGTQAFNDLAQTISTKLNISIDESKNKIREFQNVTTKEINESKNAVKEFNQSLKQIPAAAGSINALTQQVKTLEKELKDLPTTTQKFADKSKELKKLKDELRAIKQEAGLASKTLSQALKGSALDSAQFGKSLRGLSTVVKTAFGFGAIRAGVSTLKAQFNSLVETYKDSNAAILAVDTDINRLGTTVQETAVAFIEANQEGISKFVNLLNDSIPVLKENATFLLQIAGALALFIARQRVANILTIAGQAATFLYNGAIKLLTGQIQFATIAQKAFNTASKANPIGLIVGAIAVGVAAYATYNQATKEAKEENKLLEESTKKVSSEFLTETKDLRNLFGQLKQTNKGSSERKEIINKLNEQYGEYLPKIDLENASMQQLKIAYDETSKAIIRQIVTKQKKAVADKLLDDIVQRSIDLQQQLTKTTNESSKAQEEQIKNNFKFDVNPAIVAQQQNLEETGKLINVVSEAAANQDINVLKEDLEGLDKTFEAVEKTILDLLNKSGIKFEDLFGDVGATSKELKNENKNIIQILNERKSALEESIKILIASGKDYSKQLNQLEQVTKQLTDVQEEFNEATRFGETQLKALERTQQELLKSIKESISTEQDYSQEQEKLAETQKELNRINEQYDKIINLINQSTEAYVKGSLKDYDQRIKALQEEQQNFNILSEDYAILTIQITQIESERARVQELLNFNLQESNRAQLELNEQLSDSEAQRKATGAALQRISLVTDATEKGAQEIAQIEKELAEQLAQIGAQRLQSRAFQINDELLFLEQKKNEELQEIGTNEALKLAIEKEFQNQRLALLLEQSQINTELLDLDVERFKEAQSLKTQTLSEETSKQAELFNKVIDVTSQFTSKTLDLIAQANKTQFDAQKTALTEQEQAALKSAEQFGASEQKKQQIREDFAKKQEKLQKQQAAKEKEIALARAFIEQSILVIKALQTAPAPNFVAAGIAAALGALQIGIILATKFKTGAIFDGQVQSGQSRFAKGAFLSNGAYHSQGGMPILNPYTGQKVAEIEKGEAIINKRVLASREKMTLSGTPYEIASQLNSHRGFGVSFPKKFASGGYFKAASKLKSVSAQSGIKYQTGGRFGISNNILKLQSGAVLAADIAREANSRYGGTNQTNSLLQALVLQVSVLTQVNQTGFESVPSTAQELQQVAQLQKDENNAS
jgi:hypothetical protein